MNKPAFFSDLDQTLIYSIRQLAHHGQSMDEAVMVEEYDGAPLSYLTASVLDYFISDSVQLVPVTTRTLAQYSRIVLPGLSPSSFIVLNGGRIFLEGEELRSWTRCMADELDSLPTRPMQLHSTIQAALIDEPLVKAVHHADESFVYVVKHQPRVSGVDDYLAELAGETGYTLSHQGRKSYLTPPNLSKGRAVGELKKHLDPSFTFAAGDSFLDLSMKDHVDAFWVPSHGEAASVVGPESITVGVGMDVSAELVANMTARLVLNAN